MVFDVKRILHVARRVVFGHVHGCEVVIIAFEFGSVEGQKTKAGEKAFNSAAEMGGGVQVPKRSRREWWLRDIEAFVLELGGQCG
jgi:hypothetical protein